MGQFFSVSRTKQRSTSRILAVLTTIGLATATVAAFQLPAHATTQTFVFSGGPQIYVVPDGVTQINATLAGAQGGSVQGGASGGAGGLVQATIAVNPGEVLMLTVGGAGDTGSGYNGGGRGAGTGGGASDIRRPTFSTQTSCAYTLTCTYGERIIVAGGGGGAGGASGGGSSASGGNGGTTPGSGSSDNFSSPVGTATGGSGGGPNAGGAAGAGTFQSAGQGAGNGGLGDGGASAWVAGATGGGGGGGYFGGGGGGVSQDGAGTPTANGAAGGGGGKSWAGGTGVSSPTFTDGSKLGSGSITIDPPSAITNAAFGFTGAPQFYTVPANTSELYFRIYGAGGTNAGPGDIVYGRLPVTAGQVLQVNIGGRGYADATFSPGHVSGEGGWNGGGDATRYRGWGAGSGGGGGTDLRSCTNPSAQNLCALTDRLIVAGGGGGGSYGGWGLNPGHGGFNADGSGGDGGLGDYGLGGTLTAGGGVTGTNGLATPGTLGVGGSAGDVFYGAGAGGGGFYGGGGANSSGGGGGSSCASITGSCSASANILGTQNAQIGHSGGYGSVSDGMAVVTAMPIATTGSISNLTSTTASVAGTINAKFLASTPTLFLGTSQATINSCSSVSAPCSASNAVLRTSSLATRIAGTTTQSVSGSITGLSPNTTYYYRVCAQSVAGYSCGSTSTFTTQLSVTNTALANGTADQAYTDTLLASGGSGTYSSWALVNSTTLPAGLTLNTQTGVISGTPSAASTGQIDVQVTDSLGATVIKSLGLTIAAAPPAPPGNSAGPTGPQVIGISPNITTPIGGNTMTITGSNLAGSTVTVGTTPVVVITNTGSVISFVAPSGLSGSPNITIVSALGTLRWQGAIRVTNVSSSSLETPGQPVKRSKVIVFEKFAPGSSTLTSSHLSKLKATLKSSVGFSTMECVGFTMGPTVLKGDTKLAMARSSNICAALHRLAPKLKIIESTGITETVMGSQIRRVEVTFRD